MRTYLDHWRLLQCPFENSSSPRFYVNNGQHREALERLHYIVRDRNMGFGLLTGEIGCGKTILTRVLKETLTDREHEVVLLPNTPAEYKNILKEVFGQMRAGPGRRSTLSRPDLQEESDYQLQCRFLEMLEAKVIRPKKHMVLILDEAQQMIGETLLQLKGLINMAERDQSYLTVILFGQAELVYQVQELPQIDQRIGLRYHLRSLSLEETGKYVDGRMNLSGYHGPSIFPEKTRTLLHGETAGFPREINRICKLALDRAYSQKQLQIRPETVQTIVEDVFRQSALAM